MKITVRGKNIEVTDALRQYVEKKVSKIAKLFDNIGDVQVVLCVEKGRHIVEVTVPVNGMLLRGEKESEDMYASIDMVIEKIERQIEKQKTKLSRKLRSGFKLAEVPVTQGVEEEAEPRIVRTKRFAMKPMAVEEAILQMNLIGHDFFVFSNADTKEVNVVYRRRDGNYGLIEPSF